jgi:hypothetical protein
LNEHQRGLLDALTPTGNTPARPIRRAPPLLLADVQRPAPTIAAMLQTAAVPVTQTCKRWLTAGLEAARDERPRSGARCKRDGRHEAHLVAVAWSTPPPPERDR